MTLCSLPLPFGFSFSIRLPPFSQSYYIFLKPRNAIFAGLGSFFHPLLLLCIDPEIYPAKRRVRERGACTDLKSGK